MSNGRRGLIELIQVSNIVAFLLMLVINFMSANGRLNGMTPGEVSNQYMTLLTPAAYTFKIWWLIYFLLALFLLFQIQESIFGKGQLSGSLYEIGWWFVISCISNALWLIAWSYEKIGFSVFFMVLLLISLTRIYKQMEIGIRIVSMKIRLFVHLPFSIYLGWICAATVSNISVFLQFIRWNRFGLSETFWFLAMIIFLALLTGYMLSKRKDVFFGGAVLWALVGILAARVMVEPVYYIIQGVT